jgi:hypothetical protein
VHSPNAGGTFTRLLEDVHTRSSQEKRRLASEIAKTTFTSTLTKSKNEPWFKK